MAKTFFATIRLKPLSNSKALATNGTGTVVESTTTATELGYLAGTTSAVQTQLDGKQPLDADLTALAGLASTGIIARTGAGTVAARTLTAGSSKLSVTDGDGVAGNPTLDVVPANIDHDALLNFVANEHVDHSAVSIATASGSSGLTGGGDITTTRNLSVDITGTTASGGIDGADEVMVWDVSSSALRKTTVSAIAGTANPSFKTNWTTADTATFAITHSLGTKDVVVEVFDVATGDTIEIDSVTRTSTSVLTVVASEAPPATDWRVLIHTV